MGLFWGPRYSYAGGHQISIEVESQKANGEPWDAGMLGTEAPDLAICLDNGDSITCYPGGRSPKGILEPKCRNSHSCLFNVDMASDKIYTLTIVDVDVADNDIIGSGTIAVGLGARTLGQALVIVL